MLPSILKHFKLSIFWYVTCTMEKTEEHDPEGIKFLLFPTDTGHYKNLNPMVLIPLFFPVSFDMNNSHSLVQIQHILWLSSLETALHSKVEINATKIRSYLCLGGHS